VKPSVVRRRRQWRVVAGLWALAAACLALLTALWSCSRGPAKPNVVLVVVDALRPDYLGCYGYDRPTSPTIDKLAAEGILFETAVNHASWTKPCFSSLLTSLYPFQHGVVDWESAMPESIKTLAEVLRANGYATMGVINMLGLAGPFQVTRGMDSVNVAVNTRPNAIRNDKRDAVEVTDIAIGMMRRAKQPYFILIHYLDTHFPYRVSPEYVDVIRKESDSFGPPRRGALEDDDNPPEELAAYINLQYAACIRRADEGIGRLVAFLDAEKSRANTVLIITADHGESLGEHGSGAHGAGLYDAVVRVPLILSYPAGYQRPKRIVEQVRHIDLLPTIVELTGARDVGWREGTSLCRLIDSGGRGADAPGKLLPQDHTLCENTLRRAPFSKCIRTADWKLMVEPATGITSFFDLEQDPKELVNIAGTGLEVEASLAAWMARIPGVTLNGWRVAVIGRSIGAPVEIYARPVGGRIADVDTVMGGDDLKVEAAEDGSAVTIKADSRGMRMVVLETQPAGVPVEFEVRVRGEGGPGSVLVGKAGSRRLGSFTLTQQEAEGLPATFEDARKSRTPAVCIWWMAGEPMRRPVLGTSFTDEERARLKALGYLQ
jgi:choline-sulfatase